MSTETNPILDHVSAKEMPAFGQVMPRVTAEYGKSLSGQLKDLMALCLRGNKLLVDEYYHMKLFDDKTYSSEDKKQFAGLQKSRMIWGAIREVNPWHGFMADKLASELLLKSFGLPVTDTLAIVGGNYPGNTIHKIGNVATLEKFLVSADYPLFGKPVDSYQSLGSARFEKYDAAGKTLFLTDGKAVSVEDLWAEIETHFDGSYLFQSCIIAHSMIHKMCGAGLPTVRIVTIDNGSGPEFYRSCVKITGKNNVADNFWRTGNLLAAVDQENGTLGAALTGMGIDGEFVETHPDTGHRIEGTVLPYWEEAKKLALEVAGFYKDAVLIGFDMAITDKGPVIVEVNNDPHLIMLQVALRKGILDAPMLDMISYVEKLKTDTKNEIKGVLKQEQKERKEDMSEALTKKVA